MPRLSWTTTILTLTVALLTPYLLYQPSKMSGPPPYNNLTYYTFGTPNGLKPAIVLEELGLQYKVEKVDITKNTQKEDWFLAINPNGRIPALKDGEMRVFETCAIMVSDPILSSTHFRSASLPLSISLPTLKPPVNFHKLYLTDHYDKSHTLNYPSGTQLYYEVLSWVMWQQGGLGPMQGQANHFRAMAGAYSSYGINRYMTETQRLFDVLESRLSTSSWLAGDKYTIADIASYSWVRAAPIFLGEEEFDLAKWPGIQKWHDRIAEREAVKKALTIPEGTRGSDEMREMAKGMRAKIDGMKDSNKDS